jgi:hypothetical protein
MYPNHILDGDRGVYANPRDLSVIAEPLRSIIYTAIEDCPYSLWLNSGLRSPWQQYLLRVGRCGAAMAFDSDCKGNPTTALPYRSKHQQGTAVDMAGVGLSWLIAHRAEYGLGLTVPGENWHFEVVGSPTRRILRYPGTAPLPPPTLEDDMDEDTLFELIGGAVRPHARIVKITGDGVNEAWVTNGLDLARRAGPKYAMFLDEHFNTGGVIILPIEDAAIIGNIVATTQALLGKKLPDNFAAGNPRTWP